MRYTLFLKAEKLHMQLQMNKTSDAYRTSMPKSSIIENLSKKRYNATPTTKHHLAGWKI